MTVKVTKSILEGYVTELYEVDTNSKEEAMRLIDNNEVDPIDTDTEVRSTEVDEVEHNGDVELWNSDKKIIVEVRGGIAYCDDPRVEIIDYDNDTI